MDHTIRIPLSWLEAELGKVSEKRRGKHTSQSNNINRSLNRSLGPKEKRHPDQVQPKLNGIKRRSMLSEDLFLSRRKRRHADGIGAVGAISHQAVEESPCRAEDLGRWAVGWLLEGEVGFLSFFCWGGR